MQKRLYHKGMLALAVVVVLMCGCKNSDIQEPNTDSGNMPLDVYSNLVSQKEQAELKNTMKDAGLSGTDVFFEWVQDYNSSIYLDAFPAAWKERGVTFGKGKASLITVVMNDSFDEVLFIGHTGVLIEMDGYLLFIEKLAPGLPYQVTKYSTRAELAKELLGRPQYTLGDEDFGTFLMENDHALQIKSN